MNTVIKKTTMPYLLVPILRRLELNNYKEKPFVTLYEKNNQFMKKKRLCINSVIS